MQSLLNIKCNTWRTAALILCGLLLFSCTQKHYTDALSPEEALKHFEIVDGFKIELFASEPDIMSPVDMVFDEQGNIYVVEMGDYPYQPEGGKGKGRIRMLKDTNGDGKPDTSYVFADGLPSATSMLPWKSGLIVTAAPDILYLKDTTGDFHADIKEVLFTGFFASNSEAQITSLRLAPDNWIYANNNGQAGTVHAVSNPDTAALSMGGSDFRFRPDKGLFEKESGNGQFGLAIDDWGNRFYTQNTIHIQQAPVPLRYLHRHTYLPSDRLDVNISDHDLVMFQKTPPPYWRLERSNRRQKDYDERKLSRNEYAEDHFTGASGGTFYGGDAFPESFRSSIFTGDVAGNLVHRDVLTLQNNSPLFVAKRAEGEKDREFLASTDPWFRPANFTVGPDGYLYIIDMYRQHIETPVSIPEDLKKDMDFTNGEQYGRIYRVVPEGAEKKQTQIPNLRSKAPEALVALLAHPNQWWRLQAQRLLLEYGDLAVVPALKKIFAEHTDARARLHALYTLEGLNALDAGLIQRALKDPDPGMRTHAIILSERYPQCLPQLLTMVGDSSAQVVLQLALSLGEFALPQVIPALANIIERYGEAALFQTAVLSSDAGSSMELLKLLISRGSFFKDTSPEKIAFVKDYLYVIGARKKKEDILALIALLSHPEVKEAINWQLAGLEGLTKGLQKSANKSKPDPDLISAFQVYESGSKWEIKSALKEVIQAMGDSIQ